MDQNGVKKMFDNLSPEQQKKIEKIISDKSETEKILSSPQAQAIIKKLMGEK